MNKPMKISSEVPNDFSHCMFSSIIMIGRRQPATRLMSVLLNGKQMRGLWQLAKSSLWNYYTSLFSWTSCATPFTDYICCLPNRQHALPQTPGWLVFYVRLFDEITIYIVYM